MWACALLTQTHGAENCPSPSWSHGDLAGHMLGLTAMGGGEGQAKQRPRLFCHRFQTLPTLQTPEHFQMNKQDPTEQIYADYFPGLLWDFGAYAQHKPHALGNRGATSPNAHMLRVAAGQGWVMGISLQQCTLDSYFHLRGHGWEREQAPYQ